MKLQVGEKVRFLNEAIEGIVTKILNNDRVEVMDQYGFTHTAPEKFLVREVFIPKEHNAGLSEDQGFEEEEIKAPPVIQPVSIAGFLEKDETIYAAINLVNPDLPYSSDVELRLVNNCSNTIAFTVSKRMDSLLQGITAGVLKPMSEWLIGVYSPDEIQVASTQGFSFQFLFFNEQPAKTRQPVEKVVKFSSSDFVESHHWNSLKYPGQKILLMPLYKTGSEKAVDVEKLLERYNKDMQEKEKARIEESKKVKKEKFILLEKEREVDLHIENLLKDYSAMSNSQIISYQIKHFLHEMDRAILDHIYKITFIHGVGEGVLKSAIREELKKFPRVKYSDAPYEKFGYGATEVVFK